MPKERKNFWCSNKKIVYFIIFFGIIIFVALLFPYYRVFKEQDSLNLEIKKYETEIAGLEKQNKEYLKLLEYLKSKEYLESEARVNLGLKKEGERVIVIENQKFAAEAKVSNDNTELLSGPGKWRQYFFE